MQRSLQLQHMKAKKSRAYTNLLRGSARYGIFQMERWQIVSMQLFA
jgi:hypothetical protein